jgi:hypothetical protein
MDVLSIGINMFIPVGKGMTDEVFRTIYRYLWIKV